MDTISRLGRGILTLAAVLAVLLATGARVLATTAPCTTDLTCEKVVASSPVCPALGSYSPDLNPTEQEIASQADALSLQYKVPAVLIKAVMEQETGWLQVCEHGCACDGTDTRPCGRGLMQITLTAQEQEIGVLSLGQIEEGPSQGDNPFRTTLAACPVDVGRLSNDWRYNMEIGVRRLVAKRVESCGAGDDARILENWYYPLAYYNGAGRHATPTCFSSQDWLNDPTSFCYGRAPQGNDGWANRSVFPYQESIFNIVAQEHYVIPESRRGFFGPGIKVTLPGPAAVGTGAGHFDYVDSEFCFFDYYRVSANGTVQLGGNSHAELACKPACEARPGPAPHIVPFGNPASGPDLSVRSVQGPLFTCPGERITVSVRVANTGSMDVGALAVGIYLSTDSSIDPHDRRIASRTISSLATGSEVSVDTTILLSTSIPLGTYYLGAIADYPGRIQETNEDNNARVGNRIGIGVGSDLVISDVSGPSAIVSGTYVNVPNTIRNIGTGNACSASIGLFLTTGTTDYFAGDRKISLLPGALDASATRVLVPTGVPAGRYSWKACADHRHKVPESDESNNCRTGDSTDLTIGPDLTVPGIGAPAAGCPGSTLVSYTVRTLGTGGASCSLGFYLSRDQNITTADVAVGHVSITLSANDTRSGSLRVTIPTTVLPGGYHLGAIADDRQQVIERDEGNNTASSRIELGINSDLFVTEVSAPDHGATGASMTISTTVKNQGTGYACGVYAGLDLIGSSTTWNLATLRGGNLSPGQSKSISTSVLLSPAIPPGPYTVRAVADPLKRVPESDETNNGKIGNPVAVEPGPDFTITSVNSQPDVCLGQRITISNRVQNVGIGTASVVVGLYLVPDPNVPVDTGLLMTRTIRNFAAGSDNSASTLVTIPRSWSPGTYYVRAVADPRDLVRERDEANNRRTGNAINIRDCR